MNTRSSKLRELSPNWRKMAELGWLSVGLPEAYGGLDGGPVEHMVIMEGIGRGLVLEPFLTTAVLGAGLLLESPHEPLKQDLLPRVATGEMQLAFACAEPQSRYDLFDVATTAVATADGWRLDGHKAVVMGGPTADRLIVTARNAGERRDRDGITLFVVDPAADGVRRRDYPTVDGLRASEVELTGVEVGTAHEASTGSINGPESNHASDDVSMQAAEHSKGTFRSSNDR